MPTLVYRGGKCSYERLYNSPSINGEAGIQTQAHLTLEPVNLNTMVPSYHLIAQKKKNGAPRWLSELRVHLLIWAQVMTSWFVVSRPTSDSSAEPAWRLSSLLLSLPLRACPLTLKTNVGEGAPNDASWTLSPRDFVHQRSCPWGLKQTNNNSHNKNSNQKRK